MKQNDSDNGIYQMESTGNRDRQDGVFGERVEMSQKVGTMGFRQRFSVLEEIRFIQIQEDLLKARRRGLQRMIEHDNRLVAFHCSDTKVISQDE